MESHEGLTPQIETAQTIKDAVEEAIRRGYPIEIPGRTVGEPPVESKIQFMSGGAVEHVKLMRVELGIPLMVLTQTDSSQGGRTYEITIAAINKEGVLNRVRYDNKGDIAGVEVIGPWEQKANTAKDLGIYNLDNLPKKINSAKLAGELLEGVRMRTFRAPDIMRQSMDTKVVESKPIKSPPPAGKAPVRKAA